MRAKKLNGGWEVDGGGGDRQQMFSKGRAAPHLGGSVPGLGDPQAGASTAYSILCLERQVWARTGLAK